MLEHLLTLLTELQAAKSEADLQSLKSKLEQYPFKDLLDGTCVITPHGVWDASDLSDDLTLEQKQRVLLLLMCEDMEDSDWLRVDRCVHKVENEHE